MDSQMARPHDYSYGHEPHNAELHAGEGEDGHHHEKKSVLEKVKAKAKKIKDTLKLHGHGHHDQDHLHHEGDHVPDDYDLDEEDDEPVIHGASVFDSAASRSSVPEQVEKLGDTGSNYGSSAATKDQEDSSQANVIDSLKSFVPVQEEDGGLKVSVERTSNMKEGPQAPQNTLAAITSGIVEHTNATDPIQIFAQEQVTVRGQPEIDLEHWTRFEEDPDAPKNRPPDHIPSNYETKVTNPTGEVAQEIEVTSTLHRLGKMNVSDESKPEAEGDLHTRRHDQSIFSTGSHNQFSPEPTPPIPIVSQESPQSVTETYDRSKSPDHPHAGTTKKAPEQSSYTQKISSATSAIADKAITAKNVVVSTVGYGDRDNSKQHEIHDEQETSPAAYGKKIASTVTEKLTPVYEKIAETGSNLLSKATRTNNEAETRVKGQEKWVSVKDYLAEKLRPGEEDRALSEVISEALHKQKHETEKTEKKIGKVTESEEAKRHLEKAEENSGERSHSNSESISGSSVVNKLKGVVGSYFGKGTETHSPSQQSPSSSAGNEGFSTSMSEEETGEKRLQESGN